MNGGVRTDAERQRKNRNNGKPGLPTKSSKSVRNVLPKFTHRKVRSRSDTV